MPAQAADRCALPCRPAAVLVALSLKMPPAAPDAACRHDTGLLPIPHRPKRMGDSLQHQSAVLNRGAST